MKNTFIFKIFVIALLVGISQNVNAQSWRFPDCRDLEITKAVWSENSADTLLITVFNHCDTCETHIYTGLIARQEGDTLAINEYLFAQSTPSNNSEYEYTLFKTQDFEINNQIHFEMVGICDTISYTDNLFLNEETPKGDTPITIYPNPAQNMVYLRTPIGLDIHNIKLLDIQGKTLLELDKNTTQFSMKNYVNGVYILSLNTNKGLLSTKINITR